MNCGHCKSTHETTAAVKICAQNDWAARAARKMMPAAAVETVRAAGRSSLDVSGYESDAGRCGRCAGTGQFITGMLNGKPVGPGGICFRCAGKGRQDSCGAGKHSYVPKHSACCDITRNASYDTWGIRISI